MSMLTIVLRNTARMGHTFFRLAMKKSIPVIWAVVMLLSACSALAELSDYDIVTSAETNKVILDCDMGYLSDDAYCMFILAQADAAGYIDFLGVTSVGGNEICAVGINAILNQLEAIERPDIPVYAGTDIPMMGFRNLAADQPVTGGFQWTGAYRQLDNYVSPDRYHDLGALYDEAWGYSRGKVQAQSAAAFMIEQVHRYPGEVTIFAIGACTNVALACMLDPTFAENTAGIIYMGGSIDVPGNANACGEFNWFYDPEAAQICLNNDFPYQIVVPDDIAHKVLLTKDVLDMMHEKNHTPITRLFMDRLYDAYLENPQKTDYCWDTITAAIFLCPDLITETEFRDLAIDCNRTGYSYANAVTWASGEGPYASRNVQIIFNVDRNAFWTFVTDLYGTRF